MPQSIYQGSKYIGETIQSVQIGNLLTANQASATDTLGTTADFKATSSTITSVGGGYQGTKCVNVTYAGANPCLDMWTSADAGGSGSLPVIGGKTYTFSMWIKSTATGVFYPQVFWYQRDGVTQASTRYHIGTPGANLTTSWQKVSMTAVAPADAVLASMRMYAGIPSLSSYQVDQIGFWSGAGGDWQMPGVPIPNADPQLVWGKVPVWNWIGGIWVQLNADIGPVDFAMTNIHYDRATIEIHNSQNYDHVGDYRVWLKTGGGAFVRRPDLDIKDVPTPIPGRATIQIVATRLITGLAASTNYTVRIEVDLLSGGTTPFSDKSFTTPANQTPLPVTTLRMTGHTNSFIDMVWTSPAGTSATTYKVFWGRQGQGPGGIVNVGAATSYRVVGLTENIPYWYFVRGVNATGKEGPNSNQLQYHTGWGEIRRAGHDDNIVWKPREWGSYRQDIQWRWARESGVLPRNPHLYQGYWPGNNWHGPSNPSSNPPAGNQRRYWGTVVYDDDYIREKLDAKHGAGVGAGVVTSKLCFRRLYRHVQPGNIAAQDMVWHMTNANPFSSGQPPTYEKYESHDMKSGEADAYYPLAASWGTKLIRGLDDGTKVNGLVLHRSDNQTNGYGAAGYGRWSGHLLDDPDASGSWRNSDLSLMMEGSWNVLVRAYKGPYPW